MQSGKLLIFSGPSGAGKTTVLQELLKRSPRRLVMSVSATTRPKRPGEQDGVAYHFLTPEEFHRRRMQGDFLECFEVFGRGYWYGTPRREVLRSLAAGEWIVLEIDVQGMQQVLAEFPEAVTFFVRPESLAELERRLRDRGTESEEAIQRRLEVARHEWQFVRQYKFEIVNHTVDQAVDDICEILDQIGD
jgi:guanylate kinase